MRTLLQFFMLFSAILLPSCDSWSFWQSGNYEVYAIDDSTRREFGVNLGGGGIQGLVQPIVVGIGEDTRWIVIKRHPDGDKTRTEFFYLAKLEVDAQQRGEDVAHGPFTEAEMTQKTQELKLPTITTRFD